MFDYVVPFMQSIWQFFALPINGSGLQVWHLYAYAIILALGVAWVCSHMFGR